MMHQSINKKKMYFYLLILLFLSTIFNFNLINVLKNINLINSIEIKGIEKPAMVCIWLTMYFTKNE